jgi:hypothetical protein
MKSAGVTVHGVLIVAAVMSNTSTGNLEVYMPVPLTQQNKEKSCEARGAKIT